MSIDTGKSPCQRDATTDHIDSICNFCTLGYLLSFLKTRTGQTLLILEPWKGLSKDLETFCVPGTGKITSWARSCLRAYNCAHSSCAFWRNIWKHELWRKKALNSSVHLWATMTHLSASSHCQIFAKGRKAPSLWIRLFLWLRGLCSQWFLVKLGLGFWFGAWGLRLPTSFSVLCWSIMGGVYRFFNFGNLINAGKPINYCWRLCFPFSGQVHTF